MRNSSRTVISALWTAPKALMRWVKVGGCIAKPPREMRSDSGEPMGNGFGGARERAAATAAEYAPAPKPSIKRSGR